MGASEVQVPATPSATNSALDRSRCAAPTMARLGFVVSQIREIEQARAKAGI